MEIDIVQGHYFEDMSIGMEASMTHIVTGQDIGDFARISADVNPIHLDEDYAATTPFKRRIAHGLLTASYISAVLGNKLPGPGCVYVSQSLTFKAPVYIGDEVVTTLRITDLIPERRRVIFHCVSKVGDKIVLEGEAVMTAPSRARKK